MKTVKIATENDHGFIIINVCDIKPNHKPFSDEDAKLFPSAKSKANASSGEIKKQLADLQTKLNKSEENIGELTLKLDVLTKENSELAEKLSAAETSSKDAKDSKEPTPSDKGKG